MRRTELASAQSPPPAPIDGSPPVAIDGAHLPSRLERYKNKWRRMVIARVEASLCGGEASGCFLLSQTPLLGSHRSLEYLGIEQIKRDHVPKNLPPMALFGFLHPNCWRYVRIQKRVGRRPLLVSTDESLVSEAMQEWVHPRVAGTTSLRIVVRGRCLPFLVEGIPQRLTSGQVRRDAIATTVVEGSRERRALVIRRVVVDEIAVGALAEARERHKGSLNPIVYTPIEARNEAGYDKRDSLVEALRAEAQHRRKLTAWRLIAVNLFVLVINGVVAMRGYEVWSVVQRLKVVEWVQRLRPHVGVTFNAMRVLNWVTLPIRWPLQFRIGRQPSPQTAPPPPSRFRILESGGVMPWFDSSRSAAKS